MKCFYLLTITLLAFCLLAAQGWAEESSRDYAVVMTVTSPLEYQNTPLDPQIDFAALAKQAGAKGRIDLNSIEVVNLDTGQKVSHSLSAHFAHGDQGRVRWVVEDPKHRRFQIRFRLSPQRAIHLPQKQTALIGVGDLLRYNAGEPRSAVPAYLGRMLDLTGDGRADLLGSWNYAHEPGWPWDGLFCYPRVGSKDRLEVGEAVRLRYLDSGDSTEFHFFSDIYAMADFADLDGDGLTDIVYSRLRGSQLQFYLNSGRRDQGGMPIFIAAGSVERQTTKWNPVRAVDLNGDGAIDFVVDGVYLKNTNPQGWPVKVAPAVTINVGRNSCFFDVDGDGAIDAVCLSPAAEKLSPNDSRAGRAAWRKNTGGDPPKFGPEKPLSGVDSRFVTDIASISNDEHRGVMLLSRGHQRASLFEPGSDAKKNPAFKFTGDIKSLNAIVSLDDQAWPCICDWDGDGDQDLLVGGGYGRPQILINNSGDQRLAFSEAKYILSAGKPIEIIRDEVLGGKNWHNMGYPYPVFVDWDVDGLPDLVIPNETNRIFWYKNIGSRAAPKFGPRRQILCDGYPDSPQLRKKSADLAADKSVANVPYPYEKGRPFFWRTAAAIADYNGDQLPDLITHDGHTRKATLFVQYRDEAGKLRLRKQGPLRLEDGRLIDDTIVGRSSHWTECFRSVDWDNDGLLDLVYACAGSHGGIQDNGSIYLLRNCGTKKKPKFENPKTFRCFGEPIRVTNHGPNPWIGDIDGDGRPDLLTCVEWSVYPYYSHAALQMEKRPAFTLGEARALESP